LPDDPRLDDSAWRVFGRRFPRRWSLYFRVVAGALLVLFLVWWFTADVTYVSNVKVSGLDATPPEYQESLREIADDFAALVNRLADEGYAWQAGALPALRAADALSPAEAEEALALGALEVKKGGDSLLDSSTARETARFLEGRGWELDPAEGSALQGATRDLGPVRAHVMIEQAPEGRERLIIKVAYPAGPTNAG
jgi:hypothetical protein